MGQDDDLTKLATPAACIAGQYRIISPWLVSTAIKLIWCGIDFCLIPLGTPTASVSKEVAEVQRLLKKSGLEYSMHSAGTTVGTFGLSCR